jgi:hypothetical protein
MLTGVRAVCVKVFWAVAAMVLLQVATARAALPAGPSPSLITHTVEALICDCPVVMTGVVNSPHASAYDWTATVTPGEVLKAPPGYTAPSHFNTACEFRWSIERFAEGDQSRLEYPPSGARVLLFLGGEGSSSVLDCVWLDSPKPARSLLSDRVRDLSLKPISDHARVLAVVRAELNRTPRTASTIGIFVYPFTPYVFPDDDRLLPAAREWMGSTDPYARLAGTSHVSRLADPQDIPALTLLLDDSFVVDEPSVSPWTGRQYPIRLAAWEGLAKRGLMMPPPVLQLPQAGLYTEVSWVFVALIAASPILIFIPWRMLRRRRGAARLGWLQWLTSALTWAVVTYAIFAAGMWWRSWHTADNMLQARGGVLLNISSIQGNLFIEGVRAWPASSPLVHAAVTPNASEPNRLRRNDYFYNRVGLSEWGSLWTDYVYYRRDVPGWFVAEKYVDQFPFPNGRLNPFPASSGIMVGCSYFRLILLLLMLPFVRAVLLVMIRVLRARNAAVARRQGLCAACSYDLRAHKVGERCPECGMLVLEKCPHTARSIQSGS